MIKKNKTDFIKDYKIRKVIGYTIILMIILGFIFGSFEYKRLKSMYNNQIKITESLIGTLVEKYPKDEVSIVEAIYRSEHNKSDLGKGTLKKFGYGIDNNMLNDEVFSWYVKDFFISNIVLFLILCGIVVGAIYAFIKYIGLHLEKIYFNLENIIKDDYLREEYDSSQNEDLRVGIFSNVDDSINKLEKSLRLKFKKLNKEKEEIKSLVTDISHQLKTPLASLKLYNTLLIEEDLDKDEEIEFLNTNKYSIEKLHNLVNALVNISRLEASMINIKKKDNKIKETLNRAVRNVMHKAKENKISVNLVDFEDRIIPHDKKWTEESIFNILDNAVKYTPSGGSININIEESISYFKINIEDSGMGIDKNEFNNIFKRFYRGQSEEIENIEGSGVGLYLSRKILEEQGGNVVVSSKLGKGSKFSLLLTTV